MAGLAFLTILGWFISIFVSSDGRIAIFTREFVPFGGVLRFTKIVDAWRLVPVPVKQHSDTATRTDSLIPFRRALCLTGLTDSGRIIPVPIEPNHDATVSTRPLVPLGGAFFLARQTGS